MKSMFVRSVVLAAMLVAAPAAFAATETYTAELKGANEVPPNDSTGAGTLTATLDTATKELTFRVAFSGLSGPPTAAHFHGPAAANANAGVVVPVRDLNPPMQGKATLSDAQIADLQAGKWYFNIHTEKNKGGELRGQVLKK